MTGRIILLRHGQTYSNIDRIMDTRPPGAELTERGRGQAEDVGRELADGDQWPEWNAGAEFGPARDASKATRR